MKAKVVEQSEWGKVSFLLEKGLLARIQDGEFAFAYAGVRDYLYYRSGRNIPVAGNIERKVVSVSGRAEHSAQQTQVRRQCDSCPPSPPPHDAVKACSTCRRQARAQRAGKP